MKAPVTKLSLIQTGTMTELQKSSNESIDDISLSLATDISFDTQRTIAARIADLIKIKGVGGNPTLVIAGDKDTKRSSLMSNDNEGSDDGISDMVVEILKTTKIFNILDENRDIIDKRGFLVRIVKVVSLGMEPVIHVNIINVDATYAKSECLNVRLSSHLSMDSEALREFVINLLDYMHVDLIKDKYSLTLNQD
jgi:hypothetical protein